MILLLFYLTYRVTLVVSYIKYIIIVHLIRLNWINLIIVGISVIRCALRDWKQSDFAHHVVLKRADFEISLVKSVKLW